MSLPQRSSSPLHTLPLGEDSFANLMEACGPWHDPSPTFGVAVSGGPDSMALVLLLKEWLHKRGGALRAFHVDHRLRENSGVEATALSQQLSTHQIPHDLLRWEFETPPQSAVHFAARKARYDLLFNACRQQNIKYLFLAHHADDQAETILMRLSRSTGIDGLAGMAIKREQDGLTLVRPFLPVRKAALEATCTARGIEYLEDPSNLQLRYTRGRLRNMQSSLSDAGFTTERLCDIAREAGAARAWLESTCNDWLKTHASFNSFGAASFVTAAWKALPTPMRLRILNRVLMGVSGSEYPPRGASLERLVLRLLEDSARPRTLSGCFIQPRRETLLFTREEGMATENLPLNGYSSHQRWDSRFCLRFHPEFEREKFFVRRLGQVSRHMLVKKGAESVAALPAFMRGALPGVFDASGLVHVPEFIGENEAGESQVLVTAVFSPPKGFLLKPFCPSSYIIA